MQKGEVFVRTYLSVSHSLRNRDNKHRGRKQINKSKSAITKKKKKQLWMMVEEDFLPEATLQDV